MIIKKQNQCSLLKLIYMIVLLYTNFKNLNCFGTPILDKVWSLYLTILAYQLLIYGLVSAYQKVSCNRLQRWISYNSQDLLPTIVKKVLIICPKLLKIIPVYSLILPENKKSCNVLRNLAIFTNIFFFWSRCIFSNDLFNSVSSISS